jgi:hypothetical protein
MPDHVTTKEGNMGTDKHSKNRRKTWVRSGFVTVSPFVRPWMITQLADACFVTHGLLTEHRYHGLYICLASLDVYILWGGSVVVFIQLHNLEPSL